MKKYLLSVSLFVVLFLLAACSQSNNMLEGNSYSVYSHNPTIELSEIKELPDSRVNFHFDNSKDMTVSFLGEEYKGNYKLNDDALTITVVDKNNNEAKMLLTNLEKYEQNEDLLLAKVEESSVPDSHSAYHALSGFSIGEMLLLKAK